MTYKRMCRSCQTVQAALLEKGVLAANVISQHQVQTTCVALLHVLPCLHWQPNVWLLTAYCRTAQQKCMIEEPLSATHALALWQPTVAQVKEHKPFQHTQHC